MYWGMGQLLLKAGKIVERHPQLFGTYITNFSCGPDSFILGYFRDIMGKKPSLTLELDSHTADAGLETRIEAFIDIINSYRRLISEKKIVSRTKKFIPAKVVLDNGVAKVTTSSGRTLPSYRSRRYAAAPVNGPVGHGIFCCRIPGKRL